MIRSRFRRCGACGEYHWTDAWPPNHVEPEPQRSSLPSPILHRDQMNELWHPHNGRHYDSKSEFRRVTRMAGSEEVGNDAQNRAPAVAEVSRSDVGEAIRKVKAGYKPQLETAAASGDGWH